MGKRYLFIINTNKYAGNFEREMCAYSTGQVGECEVGGKQAKIFEEKFDSGIVDEFEQYILQVGDENGCCRPCCMYNNNSEVENEYHAVCIYFDEIPTSNMTEIMRERSIEYGRMKGIEVLSFELLLEETVVTKIPIDSFNTK